MSLSLTLIPIVTATAADGQLAGASLDQSIKQLPTRHKIGLVAYSEYSRASDLGPGILSYGHLGVGAALLTIAAAVAAFLECVLPASATPLYMAAGLAVLHSLVTTQAAPTNFSQRRVAKDELRWHVFSIVSSAGRRARHAAGAQLWRDPMGARYLRLGFLGDNVWKGSPTTQTGRKTYGTAQRFSLVGVG